MNERHCARLFLLFLCFFLSFFLPLLRLAAAGRFLRLGGGRPLLLLRLLQHLFDNLLLLDQERAHDALLDAVGAARATVRARHCLLRPRDLRVFTRAQRRDLKQKQRHHHHHHQVRVSHRETFPSFIDRRCRRLSPLKFSPLPPPTSNFLLFLGIKTKNQSTHALELQATITAFRRGSLLLGVQVSQVAAGRLDHPHAVRARVVSVVRGGVISLIHTRVCKSFHPRISAFSQSVRFLLMGRR